MRRLAIAALLAALAGAPSVGWAGTTATGAAVVADTVARRYAAPAPVASSPGEVAAYAVREAAAPALATFAGGGGGIYIGGSALVIVLLVIIIVILV